MTAVNIVLAEERAPTAEVDVAVGVVEQGSRVGTLPYPPSAADVESGAVIVVDICWLQQPVVHSRLKFPNRAIFLVQLTSHGLHQV